jgi:hypothetical protein
MRSCASARRTRFATATCEAEPRRERAVARNAPNGYPAASLTNSATSDAAAIARPTEKTWRPPQTTASRFWNRVLREAPDWQTADERVRDDGADEEEERLGGVRDPVRVREHGPARRDREGVAIGRGARRDRRAERRSVSGEHHTSGFADRGSGPPGSGTRP